jgi:hypothetical protein
VYSFANRKYRCSSEYTDRVWVQNLYSSWATRYEQQLKDWKCTTAGDETCIAARELDMHRSWGMGHVHQLGNRSCTAAGELDMCFNWRTGPVYNGWKAGPVQHLGNYSVDMCSSWGTEHARQLGNWTCMYSSWGFIYVHLLANRIFTAFGKLEHTASGELDMHSS